MNRELVDRIVAATLYEGYLLYPYRPSSVKNQVRWTFGGVYPREYSEAVVGAEPWAATTECLLRGGDDATVDVTVRFLHAVARTAARLEPPAADAPADAASLRPVDAFELDGRIQRTWEEAAERRLEAGTSTLRSLLAEPRGLTVSVDAGEQVEWLRGEDGLVAGALVRAHQPLTVAVDISATRVSPDIARLRVAITNVTTVTAADVADRGAALRHALLSTHVVLGTKNGAWLSLADPPADAVQLARDCVNTGLWPILVGAPGSDDTVLASPIILEDHPQLAPESAGELFDSTEIDEILSLRILTLTDAEKAEMRGADERARAILERTESLTGDDFMRMHGTLRSTAPRIGGTE
ncbi:MAG: hypothetical protein DLM65_13985 [Candidatus Aeolococcus gillhamiae]|uniref:Uncharacterized protein n=1 Tax=Candidatus Aeolococcus gillhamiae TaxID=3127015 RepID=A0A2W5ZXM8_9BACT|nr:MAG: hypothetical protein DLM65_13985 [Candidatus Dormibacter sp. RRmetagenome_bin12]